MRKEKQLLLNEIESMIEGSNAVIFTDYRSLTPNISWTLRHHLKKSGASFEVVKKRVLVKAAKEAGFDLSVKELKGHIGLVLAGKDPIDATKAVLDFSKDHEGVLSLLGGYFEKRVCSAQDVEQISKLPSKDVMRAQFLGLLEAPMAQVLAVLEAVLTSVPYCLENKIQKDAE